MNSADTAAAIADLKDRLDTLRPASAESLANLDRWYDVELTYGSNAIEGNTLTLQETALVIEKGITIGGKPLISHMEALDHFEATKLMRGIADQRRPVTEADVLDLHRIVTFRSKPEIMGRYADVSRRIVGSRAILPAPHKIPALMDEFGVKLAAAQGWAAAFEAHCALVAIHPFSDANGRTARLLMNLLLLRDGYTPVSIGPEQRADYLSVLERRSTAEPLGHGTVDLAARSAYTSFMSGRLIASLRDYLARLGGSAETPFGRENRAGPRRLPC